ncbi:Glycosyltransferase involved in cell wall bisynthesis [Mesonia phycicola]|uniref:Glycosyltransferase involved in cell wall bisynthesis n=1 Tax=Mesonia phycicola TaxID=579105 RepID=A0A1M6AMK2_9FLAO|nr:glycosyltransferase family 2 protein [Mesonia phycicola]SHI37730.1 Glycosyltransferase involved in cell wall bisynthesis [Mesonia phycicola]
MNKEEQLVSIIIPMFERYNLLNDLWDCLQKQTYTNFEVIIVDDGSCKPIVLPSFLDHRFSLIRYNDNKGPGYARRIGRENAKGDYICYLDSDDWWSSNYLAELVNDLNNNSNVGMVYSQTAILFEGELKYKRAELTPLQILPSIFLQKKRSWSTSSSMWRSEVSLARHWCELRNNEDYVHDIYSSKINNNILYNEKALTYKNQSAHERIKRNSKEVKKALVELLTIKNFPSYQGFTVFFMRRIYDFDIRFNFKQFWQSLKFLSKEFKISSLDFYCYFLYLLYLNFIGGKSVKLKRYFKL